MQTDIPFTSSENQAMNAMSVRKECLDRYEDGVNEQAVNAASGKNIGHALACIRWGEMLASNLGCNTNYPEFFMVLLSTCTAVAGQ